MSYFIKIPSIIKFLFPKILWKGKKGEKIIYLTFDDGPNPKSTAKILKLLEKYKLKATFFCLGDSVEKETALFQLLIEKEHAIGSHSYSHANAWKHSHKDYVKDVDKANSIIQSNLFRPPYGRLKWRDYRALKSKYKIVMWSVMPGDWDKKVDEKTLLQRMKIHLLPGVIYVLHDSESAYKKMERVLPLFIDFAREQGYSFDSLTATE